MSKKNGKVGILNPRTRRIRVKRLGEDVQNSFAVDRGAVYVVSSRRMYRFSARRGRPHVDWKVRYRNSGIVKPGQADAGSGTTPTIMRGGYVAITDNADPMDVVVYRKAKRLHGRRRVVCEKPVIRQGRERDRELPDHRRPTREPAPLLGQPYFWNAVSARTGKTAWKVYAGSGLGFNNNYAGLALGRDGTAYLGVTGGVVALRDG